MLSADEPVLLFATESKVPKPCQICNLNDPWDRLVPAKSVRKLTARPWLSKKFWIEPRPHLNPLPQGEEDAKRLVRTCCSDLAELTIQQTVAAYRILELLVG